MNAIAPPSLTIERHLALRAYCALIEANGHTGAFEPRYAAQRLLAELVDAGFATMAIDGDTITMFGVKGRAGGTNSAPGLLQNWRTAALARLSGNMIDEEAL